LDEILEKEEESSFFDMPEEIMLKEPAKEEEAALAEEAAAIAAEIEPAVVSEEKSPLPVKGTSFDESNRSDAITIYVRSIQRKISRAISFPYEAKKQGWSGTVKLSMLVLSDGSLSDVTVRESSGHGVLDKDAVNTTQILAPFEPFPAEIGLEELWVTLPIIYTQESI
jgi:protein TonB